MQLSDITPNLYPTHLLSECESGLCLFGAGFYGGNDAIHMYDAGIKHVEVVDFDFEKLWQMKQMYPKTWHFSHFDINDWVAINGALPNQTWDIVSVDAPMNMFSWVLGNFDEIAKMANKYIVLTMSQELEEESYYYLDNPDWYLKDTMIRSVSGLIVLLVLARGVGGMRGPERQL